MLRPGEWLDGFEVLRTLGRSMDTISYLARRRGTGEQVVLKVQERGADEPGAASRFVREAQLLRSIHHPAIQAAVAASVDSTPRYLALEYVEGRSLRDMLEADDRPGIAEAIRIMRQVLKGLAAMHAQGLVHRDVKPENILVRANGSVKLIDFGSAGYAATAKVGDVQIEPAGTPDYAAPEQVLGRYAMPAADVYAAGAVLYELLTGSPPFVGDNAAAVLYQKVHTPPPHPRSRRPGLSAALDRVVDRALHMEPGARYAGAAEMLTAIERTPEARHERDLNESDRLDRLARRLVRRDRP